MSEATIKPGYKTTEFWLTLLAMLLSTLLASGVMDDVKEDSIWGKIVGGAVAILVTLGYQVRRTKVKTEVKTDG